jgi:flagellar biosynthesis protein FlhF
MKIKRFVATDIRQAMRMVKEELGADAVIMSNKSVPEGVEIVAAKDFDEQLVHEKLQNSGRQQQESVAKSLLYSESSNNNKTHIVRSQRKPQVDGSIPKVPGRRKTDHYIGYAERVALNAAKSNGQAKVQKTAKQSVVSQKSTARTSASKTTTNQGQDSILLEMRKELRELKAAINSKFNNSGQESITNNNPIRLDLLRKLTDLGIAKKQAIKVANRLSGHTDIDMAWNKALEMLGKTLLSADQSILETGGVVALVGPTGVGKTTTIAKLAANYILKHGAGTVALITTDNYRIAAHEQLHTYGRILDVPVSVVANNQELHREINSFSDKQLILIDTAGMSQRDMRLAEQISILQQGTSPIKSYLVMSATTQLKAMNEIIEAFQIFDPEAVILTKLDETVTKGSAISALIENQLPLAFITDGQQVPEDLHEVSAKEFILQCADEMEQEQQHDLDVSEEWLAEEYA